MSVGCGAGEKDSGGELILMPKYWATSKCFAKYILISQFSLGLSLTPVKKSQTWKTNYFYLPLTWLFSRIFLIL